MEKWAINLGNLSQEEVYAIAYDMMVCPICVEPVCFCFNGFIVEVDGERRLSTKPTGKFAKDLLVDKIDWGQRVFKTCGIGGPPRLFKFCEIMGSPQDVYVFVLVTRGVVAGKIIEKIPDSYKEDLDKIKSNDHWQNFHKPRHYEQLRKELEGNKKKVKSLEKELRELRSE